MTDLKKTFTKGALGTVAAGAMALASASPAMANDHRDRDRGGIDAGDVIAGAVIIGGIAALAGAFDGKKDRYDRRYDDRRYNDRRYNNRRYDNRNNYRSRGNAQAAIQRCVTAAERTARRAGFRYANVYEIRDVDRERRGFEVEGRIEVADRGYGYRSRGGVDRGRFSCDLRNGRIRDLDFNGIRGLR